jgi:hypothetical protein
MGFLARQVPSSVIVPLLKRHGFTDQDVDLWLERNPADFFRPADVACDSHPVRATEAGTQPGRATPRLPPTSAGTAVLRPELGKSVRFDR